MIGSIYCTKKCVCGSAFKFDENRNGLFCKGCGEKSSGPYQVRFGKKIHRRFGNDFKAAEMFLLHLRHQKGSDNFDFRDYQSAQPLGFVQQADIWLQYKQASVKARTYKAIDRTMRRAAKAWGNRNVKSIKSGDIEDFLFSLPVGNKTRNNHKSILHDFWTWLCRREDLPLPQFPVIKFKLGWRKIIDIETQQTIIDEVKRITYDKDPKTWLAIRMLSRYFHIRPGELMQITEGNINLQIPALILPPQSSKIGEPVMVFLWDDDVKEISALPRGLPSLPFFRHPPGSRRESGKAYGEKYLYYVWRRACQNLGLMQSPTVPICDLYGGTRHSTMTALAEHMSPEEIQQASGHRTNDALMRYLQGQSRYAQKAGNLISQLQQTAKGNAEVIQLKSKSAK